MRAARAAGFGTATSSNKSLSVIASRLMADDRIKAAIIEESRARLRTSAPLAVQALDALLANPDHRHHARAIEMVLSRTDPPTINQNVSVEVVRRASDADIARVTARIEQLAARAGLPALPPVVDAEFTETAP